MSVHVDVLRNDWLGGEQHPVARLYVAGGNLKIDSPDSARWRPVIEEVLADHLREQSPEEILDQLPRVFQGSFLVATPPHADSECSYRGWSPARIESVSSEHQAAAAARA
jgi:hypothetical protein